MSVRVVARIRPLLPAELDKDMIVTADSVDGCHNTLVKIPNPKNESEEFSFAFNSVYDQGSTQETIFNSEVSPHLKSLFQGLDVTIFAYGVTGTGKTHTMRGGLKLADRGVIPRLLSGVYRRAKKICKDTQGETTVDVALSYYEIYNDKVFDLLEPPEKRTPAGLPLREKDGKTQVVGLSERSCEDLKDFERMYIEANNNRITAATKLNAHSSRSHAILRVKVTQTSLADGSVRESTASAIDLAGSEDNRRTDNGKERLVESAAINKSLFVLSQCIDAISRGDRRIPYRESKMTRILSLGQNNGITIMILNLAPLRSYHLDTLSSLNVSSRAKRIEVREIENEVVFKQVPRSGTSSSAGSFGSGAPQRQPLRPLANAHNVHTGTLAAHKAASSAAAAADCGAKPIKAFAVYTDRVVKSAVSAALPRNTAPGPASSIGRPAEIRRSNSNKRASDSADASARPTKLARPTIVPAATTGATHLSISAEALEAMVEKKVSELLAARIASSAAAAATATTATPHTAPAAEPPRQPLHLPADVQRRLEALERRIEHAGRVGLDGGAATGGEADETGELGRSSSAEGMQLVLQARRHKEAGDDDAALAAYERALAFFPGRPQKLTAKIERLRRRIAARAEAATAVVVEADAQHERTAPKKRRKTVRKRQQQHDGYDDGDAAGRDDSTFEFRADEADDDDSFVAAPGPGSVRKMRAKPTRRQQGRRKTKLSTSFSAAEIEPTAAAGSREFDFDFSVPTAPTFPLISAAAATTTTATATTASNDDALDGEGAPTSPASRRLLTVVNSRDEAQIRSLSGFGPRKARDLVSFLALVDAEADDPVPVRMRSLDELRRVPGVGDRLVERAREGLMMVAAAAA